MSDAAQQVPTESQSFRRGYVWAVNLMGAAATFTHLSGWPWWIPLVAVGAVNLIALGIWAGREGAIKEWSRG